jgi:hypothetical protein
MPLEGFDKDQERGLKSKKRSQVYQSEENKWKGVYRILFPDDNEDGMPAPCRFFEPPNAKIGCLRIPDIEYQSCTGDAAEQPNIARFQEFSRLELPRLVRRTLETVVERETQPLEHKLKERLVDIVKQCQTQLETMFQAASGSSSHPVAFGGFDTLPVRTVTTSTPSTGDSGFISQRENNLSSTTATTDVPDTAWLSTMPLPDPSTFDSDIYLPQTAHFNTSAYIGLDDYSTFLHPSAADDPSTWSFIGPFSNMNQFEIEGPCAAGNSDHVRRV